MCLILVEYQTCLCVPWFHNAFFRCRLSIHKVKNTAHLGLHFLAVLFLLVYLGILVLLASEAFVWSGQIHSISGPLVCSPSYSLFAWTINPRKYKFRTSALNLGIIKPYFTIIWPPIISLMSHFEIWVVEPDNKKCFMSSYQHLWMYTVSKKWYLNGFVNLPGGKLGKSKGFLSFIQSLQWRNVQIPHSLLTDHKYTKVYET